MNRLNKPVHFFVSITLISDFMIQSTTLKFLSSLQKNNNRNWFEANRTAYEEAKQDIILFTDEVIKKLQHLISRLQTCGPKTVLSGSTGMCVSAKTKALIKIIWLLILTVPVKKEPGLVTMFI
jgi:hypothetical protein